MSQQITTAMVDTYRRGIELLAQQKVSKLTPWVTVTGDIGKRVAHDQVGPVAVQQSNTRHDDTTYINTPHKRRWVSMLTYDVADLLDEADLHKILNNPGGVYGQNFLAAHNRQRDTDIIKAALGSAFTGEDGTASVTFAADGGLAIPAGATGMTLAKISQAADQLIAKGLYDDTEQMVVAWTRKQESEFINTAEVKSIDYNTQKVLVEGTIGGGTFYGFKYVRLEDWVDHAGATQRILPKAAGTRTCVAWLKSGMWLNNQQSPSVMVDRLPTKKYSWQYYAASQFGATRLDGNKVVQIDVAEA